MSQVTLSFWGLCYLVDRPNDDRYEVYLPTGKDHLPDAHAHNVDPAHSLEHVATMAIPADEIEIGSDKITWNPDRIVHIGERQIACWDLSGKVEFESANGAGIPTWLAANRNKSINLGALHKKGDKDTLVKTSTELTNDLQFPMIVLTGGKIVAEVTSPVVYEVRRGSTKVEERNIARYVDWEAPASDQVTVWHEGQYLTTRSAVNASITITNVSTAPTSGDEHFDLYYSLLQRHFLKGDRISLKRKPMYGAGAEVYDCVPPGTGS